MKAILTAFIFVSSLFFSFGSSASDLVLPKGDFSGMKKTGIAIVENVISPLIIKLDDGRIIHLAGMDMPDLDYYDPGDLSVTTQKILRDFLNGQRVVVYQTPSKKSGRKNRLGHNIAHLVRTNNDVWVQGMLLSLGLTRVRTTEYNPEMAEQMLRLENTARKAKAGLWEMEAYKTLSPLEAEKHIGSYQIVEGVIKSVSLRKNRIYLNFGNNWRKDFTVSISAFDRKKFTKQKIELQGWQGKRIRVRGWIDSYNGPYMEINHPERFEPLFEQQTQASKNIAGAPKGSSLPDPSVRNKSGSDNALPRFND